MAVYFLFMAPFTLSFRYYILFRVMIMKILLAAEGRFAFPDTPAARLNFKGSYYGITERRHRSDGFR